LSGLKKLLRFLLRLSAFTIKKSKQIERTNVSSLDVE
jgi:hypothetical protein